jgi:hypothetical protein
MGYGSNGVKYVKKEDKKRKTKNEKRTWIKTLER